MVHEGWGNLRWLACGPERVEVENQPRKSLVFHPNLEHAEERWAELCDQDKLVAASRNALALERQLAQQIAKNCGGDRSE